MKVSKETLQTVASLSRLTIGEAEEARYLKDLDNFLTYVDKLSEVDTENIAPTTYAIPLENVLREDKVREGLTREAALANAPLREGNYFKVPKVLEE